jgi:hypothetical protein
MGYERLPFLNDWTKGIIHLRLLVFLSSETSQPAQYSLVLSRKALFTVAEAETHS